MRFYFRLMWVIALMALPLTRVLAQNLSYSRVLLVDAQVTVPSGKVWKVSNILPSERLTSTATAVATTTSVSASAATEQVITVNGNSIYIATSNAASRWNVSSISSSVAGYAMTSSASNILGSPIWLPAGTTLAAGNGVQYVSVIEFTEQP
jgi:hypothetical protein